MTHEVQHVGQAAFGLFELSVLQYFRPVYVYRRLPAYEALYVQAVDLGIIAFFGICRCAHMCDIAFGTGAWT